MIPTGKDAMPVEPSSQPNEHSTKKLDGPALLRWLKQEIDAGRVETADQRPRPTTRDEAILANLD